MDYDEPDGSRVQIAVARVPATDQANKIGSLFFNFGGPGGPAVEYLQAAGAGRVQRAERAVRHRRLRPASGVCLTEWGFFWDRRGTPAYDCQCRPGGREETRASTPPGLPEYLVCHPPAIGHRRPSRVHPPPPTFARFLFCRAYYQPALWAATAHHGLNRRESFGDQFPRPRPNRPGGHGGYWRPSAAGATDKPQLPRASRTSNFWGRLGLLGCGPHVTRQPSPPDQPPRPMQSCPRRPAWRGGGSLRHTPPPLTPPPPGGVPGGGCAGSETRTPRTTIVSASGHRPLLSDYDKRTASFYSPHA
jgi:hypothetical protein